MKTALKPSEQDAKRYPDTSLSSLSDMGNVALSQEK